MNLISTASVRDWQGNLTIFGGYYDPLPTEEITSASWPMVLATVVPVDGPALVEIKENAPYFVPCQLREAPYIGKTREKAVTLRWPNLIGKQRSASHVTESALLKYDLDGMTADQWAVSLKCLKASGLTFIAYSTWSHGLKHGIRVRVLIPMDRVLPQTEYGRTWLGAAALLFSKISLTGKTLDPSGAKIHQQQGIWATTRDREHLAFRVEGKGGIASADVFMAAAPGANATKYPITARTEAACINADLGLSPDFSRIAAAFPWIDPNTYDTWIKTGLALRALTVSLGESNALQLWLDYCKRGNQSSKERNSESGYSPETKWVTFSPTIPPNAAAGVLFGMARNAAVIAVEADRGKGQLSEQGRAAALYLATHHQTTFDALRRSRHGHSS